MRKLQRSMNEDPIRWMILNAIYLLLIWAIYQELKGLIAWYFLVICFLIGYAFGSMMIVMVIEPLLKYGDAKLESWFNSKKSSSP
jgi:hypothetical protein